MTKQSAVLLDGMQATQWYHINYFWAKRSTNSRDAMASLDWSPPFSSHFHVVQGKVLSCVSSSNSHHLTLVEKNYTHIQRSGLWLMHLSQQERCLWLHDLQLNLQQCCASHLHFQRCTQEGWGTKIITCSSSPPAGGSNKTNISTISATANSDCPTPGISNHSFI